MILFNIEPAITKAKETTAIVWLTRIILIISLFSGLYVHHAHGAIRHTGAAETINEVTNQIEITFPEKPVLLTDEIDIIDFFFDPKKGDCLFIDNEKSMIKLTYDRNFTIICGKNSGALFEVHLAVSSEEIDELASSAPFSFTDFGDQLLGIFGGLGGGGNIFDEEVQPIEPYAPEGVECEEDYDCSHDEDSPTSEPSDDYDDGGGSGDSDYHHFE